MEKLQVSTTQNVNIDYQLASVGDRIFATILDGIIKSFYALIVAMILFGAMGLEPDWWMIVFSIPMAFYNLLSDLFLNGQTFGKMALKIKVVKMDGGELTFSTCFIRWIFRAIDFFPFFHGLVALLAVIIGAKGQRIGDMAAGTTVLKINYQGDLSSTAYMELEENYQPLYPEVSKLSDHDLATIKEVILMSKKDTSYSNIGAPHPLMLKTKDVVMKKIGVETDQPAKDFLTSLLKDYNYYNQ